MPSDPKAEQRLMTEIWDPAVADDLEQFVMFSYPWGKPGTPLEGFTGPRTWQREDLQAISEHIKTNRGRMALDQLPTMWRKATASGRGVGKSALVAWLSHWMMSTRLGSTTLVTANNEPQLKTRTFAEITKWLTLAINGHWFESTVLSVRPAGWFEKLIKAQLKTDTGYYYTQGQLWSEENPDAFAGIHNPLGVNLIFDEASGIPKAIFNVAEGFFTEPTLDRYWNVFSQARRNSGGFYDVFNDPAVSKRWQLRHLDRRSVEGQDQSLTNAEIDEHGAESDHVRVEVEGKFPEQAYKQFISSAAVRAAQLRELTADANEPLIMGVDVARMGNAKTVMRWRQGRDARSIPPVRLSKVETEKTIEKIAEWIDKTAPDAVNIDAGNTGSAVIDGLRARKYRVNEVWFGEAANEKEWADRRTEMYADARNWLSGGCLDNDQFLARDLTSPEFRSRGREDKTALETKDEMRARGLPSADDGDAFVLTFAKRVARRDRNGSRFTAGRERIADGVDYPIFG